MIPGLEIAIICIHVLQYSTLPGTTLICPTWDSGNTRRASAASMIPEGLCSQGKAKMTTPLKGNSQEPHAGKEAITCSSKEQRGDMRKSD